MNRVSVNKDWMKVYVNMWSPITCDCFCNKTRKIDGYWHIKNCCWEKRLFGKLVLAYEDEILNTTETSLFDKKK